MSETPDLIELNKMARKKAINSKPPKKKYIFTSDDIPELYTEFRITRVETEEKNHRVLLENYRRNKKFRL